MIDNCRSPLRFTDHSCFSQTRKLKEDAPYQHPGIETVLRQSFFIGSDAKLYEGLFSSSIPEAPEELEVTIPMMAISATAVR